MWCATACASCHGRTTRGSVGISAITHAKEK
ncbi:TPA: EAST1 family heat-stable enterotoxin [Escherichia coli]